MFRDATHPHTRLIAIATQRKGKTMTKADFKSVRETLESRLRQSIPTQGLRESIHIQQVADPTDLTQQAAERELALHSLDRDSILSRQLRAALDRLADGSYGVCLACEDDIAPKRLMAIPWAELCIACQEAEDRSHAEKSSYRTDLRQAA
jgi:DnaK suppressor protein